MRRLHLLRPGTITDELGAKVSRSESDIRETAAAELATKHRISRADHLKTFIARGRSESLRRKNGRLVATAESRNQVCAPRLGSFK